MKRIHFFVVVEWINYDDVDDDDRFDFWSIDRSKLVVLLQQSFIMYVLFERIMAKKKKIYLGHTQYWWVNSPLIDDVFSLYKLHNTCLCNEQEGYIWKKIMKIISSHNFFLLLLPTSNIIIIAVVVVVVLVK